MKKFWRSGMIDKKIVREREQEEYIHKLEMSNLELRREIEQDYYIADIDVYNDMAILYKREKPTKPIYRQVSSKEWMEMREWFSEQLKNRREYDTYKGVEL